MPRNDLLEISSNSSLNMSGAHSQYSMRSISRDLNSGARRFPHSLMGLPQVLIRTPVRDSLFSPGHLRVSLWRCSPVTSTLLRAPSPYIARRKSLT